MIWRGAVAPRAVLDLSAPGNAVPALLISE
jgi:hypothetical protein